MLPGGQEVAGVKGDRQRLSVPTRTDGTAHAVTSAEEPEWGAGMWYGLLSRLLPGSSDAVEAEVGGHGNVIDGACYGLRRQVMLNDYMSIGDD